MLARPGAKSPLPPIPKKGGGEGEKRLEQFAPASEQQRPWRQGRGLQSLITAFRKSLG